MPYQTVIIDAPGMVTKSGVQPGSVVADLGTGREGRMALASAKVMDGTGVAYAVDVVKSILPTIATKAKMHGLPNVRTVWSNLEVFGATKAILDNSLDVGFLVTTLFQSKKREQMMEESYRMIKPGGRLVVADWKPEADTPLGPEMERRVHKSEVMRIAEKLNLQLVEEFEAGRYHWGLMFVK